MITAGISRILILVFGILYPAYSSYKAIRTKNVKEYVRWMMHWIVMAAFQVIETFSDVFLCWFPFYYETKVCIVFWLLSPMTKGSSILYKKFIHPKLSRHEQEIDDYINQAKTKGYSTVIQLGTKSFDYASKFIVETAIKSAQTIRKSYSLSDLTETDGVNEMQNVPIRQRTSRPKHNAITRSSSLSKRPTSEIYFQELEIKDSPKVTQNDYNYVRSIEDISSGYSSTMDLSRSELSRTSSNASLALRSKKSSRDNMSMSVSSTLPRRRASEKKQMRATK
ncbi:unnamed protein product [Chironomus riparius]|uniref:Receptor expression-enhancing protein n=1 Tax=Chironomus riparius TaxID=315576 RepID=A0A9N9S591_9DIPT|nr:unnamed protein product [Chironomus riparius]